MVKLGDCRRMQISCKHLKERDTVATSGHRDPRLEISRKGAEYLRSLAQKKTKALVRDYDSSRLSPYLLIYLLFFYTKRLPRSIEKNR